MQALIRILWMGLSGLLFGAIHADERRPNVLFISIDDMRPQTGAYGCDYMHTPSLDQFAAEGRLFKRHYVQVPTCGPSRACMLTGKNLRQRSDINHVHLANTLFGTSEPVEPETVVHHFKRHGYHTVGMGKISHNENGYFYNKQLRKGAPELPHSWNEYVKVSIDDWNGSLLHGFASGISRHQEPVPPFECMDVADEAYPDGVLASLATAKLAELAKQEKPFFMAVGFYKPHLPFNSPKKYWDMYERSEIPLSPNPDAPDAVDSVFLHGSSEFFSYKDQPEKGGAGKRFSDDYARQLRHANFAAVSFVDAQVGKVLDQLKASNLDQNTIVVIWGDHGWHLGDHTIWGKHSSFDRALNSLLMVRRPQMQEAGVATDALVASIDIYPTLCELAGLPQPVGLDGRSFMSLLQDPVAEGKPYVMSYWRDILSLRTDRYRMALYQGAKQQRVMLFDHESDPNEMRNIAEQYPEVVEQLTAVIKKNNHGFLPALN
ncbi:MAG: sulfatase [Opitutaceae bacterium]